MNDVEKLLNEFEEQQGWNDRTLKQWLVSFINTRRSYWPQDNPLDNDLKNFLQNIADEENTWIDNCTLQ